MYVTKLKKSLFFLEFCQTVVCCGCCPNGNVFFVKD